MKNVIIYMNVLKSTVMQHCVFCSNSGKIWLNRARMHFFMLLEKATSQVSYPVQADHRRIVSSQTTIVRVVGFNRLSTRITLSWDKPLAQRFRAFRPPPGRILARKRTQHGQMQTSEYLILTPEKNLVGICLLLDFKSIEIEKNKRKKVDSQHRIRCTCNGI